MEALVQMIIQNSKAQMQPMNARQVFFQEFDRALQSARKSEALEAWESCWNRLEQSGRAAGFSELEMSQRKSTLLWAQAHAA